MWPSAGQYSFIFTRFRYKNDNSREKISLTCNLPKILNSKNVKYRRILLTKKKDPNIHQVR